MKSTPQITKPTPRGPNPQKPWIALSEQIFPGSAWYVCFLFSFAFSKPPLNLLAAKANMRARTSIPTQYETWEEAYASIQADAKANGFAVTIARSVPRKGTNEKKKYVLVCNRSTTSKRKPSTISRRRNVNTIKCDCLWKVTVQHYKTTGLWEFTVNVENHNHEPVRAAAHAVHRRQEINEEILDLIAMRTKAGKPIYKLYE